jgi:serine-type D-Ala-D-Ala carboxypeptidase
MNRKRLFLNRRQFLQGAGGLVAATAFNRLPVWAAGGGSGGGRPYTTLHEGKPEDAGMSSELLEDVFARIGNRVNYGLFPGATAIVVREGYIVGHRAFGVRVRDTDEQMTTDTLFDLESMTKVLATATSAMILIQQGKLKLDDTVAEFLPDFAANGKDKITVADMLRYSAGLPVDNPKVDTDDRDAIWKFMAETALEYDTGTMVEYSDLTYRLLGHMLEVVAGMSLNDFAKANIWEPLGMTDTLYNPPDSLKPRIAATGAGSLGLRPDMLRGEVQDDQDWKLGGIVGCDGLFSTTMDIAIFCEMFLNGGRYNGVEILKPELIAEMVKNQTPQVKEADTDTEPIFNLLLTPKGYGWELWTHRFSSGGMRLSPGSYGKAGGAGTFMWVDPDPTRQLFGVILTNHGLPVPFDEGGWSKMLYNIGVYEFFDGIINAITGD